MANSGSPNPKTPSTNLLIADVILRGASTLLRGNVEKRVASSRPQSEDDAQEVQDGRALLTTLALYGAGKLATRSVPGLALVTTGLVVKALYDRGKARQERLASPHIGAEETADE